ncbi:MAG TPA: hypothetical protein VMY42_20245 [Thermoguttaceae bacterium]|nr:hypothetical protein [Thermoguttaceae bacterium]
MRRYCVLLGCLLSSGCSLFPEISHQPVLHNPFPQLAKIAVVPFFNLSDDPTLDGKLVASAYFNELQLVPGFEVMSVDQVQRAIEDYAIDFSSPEDARRLAQILEVDAVVIGAVTDFSAWYPPRMCMKVEWYAANPYFHPIPPGYALPWGTPEEEEIPGPLVFEAEMALARAQLKTQTPAYERLPIPEKAPPAAGQNSPSTSGRDAPDSTNPPWDEAVQPFGHEAVQPLGHEAPLHDGANDNPARPAEAMSLPPDWPDPRGFIPPAPRAQPPACPPSNAPVLAHTQAFNGHDMEFTEALASYYYFKDDARFGGWQGYLQRSEDFIRFCCHMHLSAMLSARGGAGKTRVVCRWPSVR